MSQEWIANDPEWKAASSARRLKLYAADVSHRKNCFDVVSRIVGDLGKVNYLINSVAYFKTSVRVGTRLQNPYCYCVYLIFLNFIL